MLHCHLWSCKADMLGSREEFLWEHAENWTALPTWMKLKWQRFSQNKDILRSSTLFIPPTWSVWILDLMMLQLGPSRIMHKDLTMFMEEVKAIHSKPLVLFSMDPEDTLILTSLTLLTLKYVPCLSPPDEFDHTDVNRRTGYRSKIRHLPSGTGGRNNISPHCNLRRSGNQKGKMED